MFKDVILKLIEKNFSLSRDKVLELGEQYGIQAMSEENLLLAVLLQIARGKIVIDKMTQEHAGVCLRLISYLEKKESGHEEYDHKIIKLMNRLNDKEFNN